MDREAWRSVFRSTIVTIPPPFDDDLRVKLGRMAELTQWSVKQGARTNTAPFKPVFEVATMSEGSDISLVIDRREITPATIEAININRPSHDTGGEASFLGSSRTQGRVGGF